MKEASGAECLLRLAEDGTVSAGNLEGFVSRVIDRTADSSKDDEHVRATFLTIYQLFSTSACLFEILKRRFVSADPTDTRSQYSILLFVEDWLKNGFEDEDLSCSSRIRTFVVAIFESGGQELKAKAAEIASMIYNPDYVYLRQPRSIVWLRRKPARSPPEARPSDLAAALSAVAGDWFRRITYWDYVNFIRRRPTPRRIELFKSVYDKLTEWVQRSVMKPRCVEQRAKMFENWVYTAKECKSMLDFASASAIVTALMSPKVATLDLACEKQAMQVIHTLNRELAPSSGAYYDTLRQVGTKELIPWLDPHLSTLDSTFAHSNPIVEVDGHHLVNFKLCSELAEQVDFIAQYSPPPMRSQIRPDVLEYAEYHLQSSLALKDPYAAVVRTVKHAGKARRSTLMEGGTKKSSLGKLVPPRQGWVDRTRRRDGHMTQSGGDSRRRRGGMALSHEEATTRRPEEKTARQCEEMARRRRERIVRHREVIAQRREEKLMRQPEGTARQDEDGMAQWCEEMVRWRKDTKQWRENTALWVKDLERLREEDMSVQPRGRGLMSRLFKLVKKL